MKKGSKKSSKTIKKNPKTTRLTLTVLIEGTQQMVLDVPNVKGGVMPDPDVIVQKEEEIISEIQRIFPSLNVQIVDIE